LNLPGSVVAGFVMLASPGAKIVGTAVTVRQVPKNAGEDREARLTRHQEVTRKVAGEGDVVVVDNGGRLDVGTRGGFHGYAGKQKGGGRAIGAGATPARPAKPGSVCPTLVRGPWP